ncbi:MAG: PEGA domain-containing protein [Bacteroidales bacterium]|nr:PEGA domain-containing protein [Bacteroidales bacterium]
MKKLLFIVALLFGGLTAFGQISMTVSSKAELVPDDADAASYYRQTDVNDNVCAIIKVVPDNSISGTLILQTKGGMAPVPPPGGGSNYRKESGEWWYWVSPKVTNIMFTCEGYTPTDWVGVSLQPGKVYRLRLSVDSSFTMVKTFSGSGLIGVQMTINPAVARVSYGTSKDQVINFKEVTDGCFDAFIAEGRYYFQVESRFYETWAQDVDIKKGMKEINVSLKPSFGLLKLNTVPEGADVFVDGEFIGTTPIVQSDKIAKGDHSIMFRKKDYYVANQKISVKGDGSVQTVQSVTLKPQFGTVTVLCDDKEAELVITDPSGSEVFRGKSGEKVQLNSQLTYKIESNRPSHIPQSRGIIGSTIEGRAVDVKVDAPVPIYGELQISSTPSRAEVLIDGKSAGMTIFSQTILIGEHLVELQKDGYEPLRFVVMIERDKTTQISKELQKPAEFGGEEYVDLGLSVSWAACNVGASKPEEYGDYYAWAETKDNHNSYYDWQHYVFKSSGSSEEDLQLSRYNTNHEKGYRDNMLRLIRGDDAAWVTLGNGWRLPTRDEIEELEEECDWTWTTYNGKKGCKVTGPNGKSIFIPAAGYKAESSGGSEDVTGYIWASDLDSSSPLHASFLYFNNEGAHTSSASRYFGLSIRPVKDYYVNYLVDGDWRPRLQKLVDYASYYYDNGRYKGQGSGNRNGLGVYWWKEDGDFFFGEHYSGQREGKGLYIISKPLPSCVRNCADCAFYVGDWDDNNKSGYGACYDRNGKLLYYGRFSGDKPTGTYPDPKADANRRFICMKYDDGSMYLGEVRVDGDKYIRDGYGIYIWDDNSFWVGPWENGGRKGKGIYITYENKQTPGRWDGDTRYDY